MLLTDREAKTGEQFLPPSNPDTVLSPNQQLFPLTATVNDRDCLEIGGCDLITLVQQFGSPLYILDETTLRTTCRQYRDAFTQYYPGASQVIYASKAWSCMAVVSAIAFFGKYFFNSV